MNFKVDTMPLTEPGWWGINVHLWLPPALLAALLLLLIIRHFYLKGRKEELPPAAKGPPAAAGTAIPEAREKAASKPAPATVAEAETAAAAPAPSPAPVQAPARAPVAPEAPPGTLSTGLAKTRTSFLGRLKGVFSRSTLNDETWEELEEILITSDVGPRTTAVLLAKLQERAKKEKITSPDAVRNLLKEELSGILAKAPAAHAIPDSPRPWVIMVNGVNGAGKTTTIGKLAQLLQESGKSVLLAAADTFRAAATEQLEQWAARSGAQIVKGRPEGDPGAVAFDAIKAAAARGVDVVLVDTAGRLHTKQGLMEELRKVQRVIGKAMEGAPHECWLVIDGNTGQNAAAQVREFNEALKLTGLIITKLDGTAKGGVLFAIVDEFALPVFYAGVGERLHDLIAFDSRKFVDALFEDA